MLDCFLQCFTSLITPLTVSLLYCQYLRVSYCTVDPYYDKVFCYISRNHENKKLECHAFLCNKKSKVNNILSAVMKKKEMCLMLTGHHLPSLSSFHTPPTHTHWHSLTHTHTQAEAITLTVAQAFNIAFERWQAQKKKKAARQQQQQLEQKQRQEGSHAPVTNGGSVSAQGTTKKNDLLG